MTRYVVDAPTLLHIVDRHVPIDPHHQLVAPNSIRSEVMQLLLDEVRGGARSEAEALAAHTAVTELKMRLLGDRVSRTTAWRIAREHGWSELRDAEYLAVARLQADALITVDPRLQAVAAGIVPVGRLSDLRSRE